MKVNTILRSSLITLSAALFSILCFILNINVLGSIFLTLAILNLILSIIYEKVLELHNKIVELNNKIELLHEVIKNENSTKN